MKKLTCEMLQAKGACKDQVELFKELFPNGAELSVDVAVSVADKFDFSWAAVNLLSHKGSLAYKEAEAPHWKAYKEAVAPHLKAYEEVRALHWKAYEEARTLHWKAYEEVRASHWEAYQEAVAPHLKAYEEAEALHRKAFEKVRTLHLKAYREAVAKTFAEIYIKENLE